jgi:peptidoglycan/LPS O-acetylase OafA/YrhL
MSIEKPVRFDLLDGLRGIAAIAVMVYHFTQHNGLHWLGGAWVAVDLFFILSGFVIAHSYGAKLLNGMPFSRFLLVRLIRLGPLYFLGLSIGLIAAMLSLRAGEFGDITTMQLGTAATLGAVWLPYPNNLAWPFGNDTISGPIFPLNDPAWSLFFEAFVNATFFLYVLKFRKLSSTSLVCVAWTIFLTCTVLFHQSNPGWGKYNFIFGFPRVVAEFFMGALIYQLGFHNKQARPKLTLLVGVSVAILLLLGRGALVNSITLIPLIVVLASAIKIELRTWKSICKVLGNISYPLYIVHFPMYRLVWQTPIIRTLTPLAQTVVVSVICLLFALLLAAIDERLRKILTVRISPLSHRPSPIQSGST